MDRLISADELKKKAYWMEMLDNNGIPFDVQAVSVSSIDLAPTIEAEPVRHGKWIPIIDEYGTHSMLTGHKCSLCGRCEEKEEPYCHCGAKMDGD